MVCQKKKYKSGEATKYVGRLRAQAKIGIQRAEDFRRLSILKGIYPREPNHRRTAQKGRTDILTLYQLKDIRYLLHEPIVDTLRQKRRVEKRLSRAKALRDTENKEKILDNFPYPKLDHIVKERYPSFIDAVRDLDDCLSLCFLFSTFPSLQYIDDHVSMLCRRLTVEFMHYIAEAKALRKVFVSIKGYYYQADVRGETVTWIVPHHFGFDPYDVTAEEFKLMSFFIEFYVVMLGFINFRLFHTLNLHYPPQFSVTKGTKNTDGTMFDEKSLIAERVAALNIPLAKRGTNSDLDEEIELDTFPTDSDPDKLNEAKEEMDAIKKLKFLFIGLKIFLNREVPRESLVFMIRSFGGNVSWDETLHIGSTFQETDESITHQIVDRPVITKQYISRYYVQPQWIFDSINARKLLPVNRYFIGEVLPPHLSPFVADDQIDRYVPPEEHILKDPTLLEKIYAKHGNAEDESSDEEEEKEKTDNVTNPVKSMDDSEAGPSSSTGSKLTLSVKSGEIQKELPLKERQRLEELDAKRLNVKLIRPGLRRMFIRMRNKEYRNTKEIRLLKNKRKMHDETIRKEQKDNKKKQETKELEEKLNASKKSNRILHVEIKNKTEDLKSDTDKKQLKKKRLQEQIALKQKARKMEKVTQNDDASKSAPKKPKKTHESIMKQTRKQKLQNVQVAASKKKNFKVQN